MNIRPSKEAVERFGTAARMTRIMEFVLNHINPKKLASNSEIACSFYQSDQKWYLKLAIK